MSENYPKKITFESPLDDNRSMLPARREKLKSALSKTTFTLEAENILRIDYPPEEVRQVRIVNIDDSILRVDFVLADDPADAMHRVCLFPQSGWNRKTFFSKGFFNDLTRKDTPGKTVIKFPKESSQETNSSRK